MNLQPTNLKMTAPDCLQIKWSDGEIRQYAVNELRKNCPCATCREQRKAGPPQATSLQVISKAETEPLRIAKMEAMGHYAYAIHFSDGHDTGLFTLESLRKLGKITRSSKF